MLTLSEIKEKVYDLAKTLDVSSRDLPTYGYSLHIGHPHVEIDSQGFYYAVFERDVVVKQNHTTEIDELLYWVFADVTFKLSVKYELAHRVQHQDSRRIMFQYQVDLLTKLSPQWGEREQQEHERILSKHPFDDSASDRATLAGQLRKQGISSEEVEKNVMKKYPRVPKPE